MNGSVSLEVVVKIATGLAALVGLVVAFNSYYVSAGEMQRGLNTLEQTTLDLRIDVLSDRKYRALKRGDDPVEVERLEDQIRKLEKRQELLFQEQKQLDNGWFN